MENTIYECDLHEEFAEALFKFVDEHPDKRPTKAALAKYMGRDASYLKTDGSIGWHADIINRCKIAEYEFKHHKKINDDRKKKREKSEIVKLSKANEQLKKDLEKMTKEKHESLMREIDLFRALQKAEKELQSFKNNSMVAMSVNNDWRL